MVGVPRAPNESESDEPDRLAREKLQPLDRGRASCFAAGRLMSSSVLAPPALFDLVEVGHPVSSPEAAG